MTYWICRSCEFAERLWGAAPSRISDLHGDAGPTGEFADHGFVLLYNAFVHFKELFSVGLLHVEHLDGRNFEVSRLKDFLDDGACFAFE